MRLIDADNIHYCEYDLDSYHSFSAVTDDEIAEMPTIDAAPVVHGRWIANRICSICRKGLTEWAAQNGYYYCPNCGAKMDGE